MDTNDGAGPSANMRVTVHESKTKLLLELEAEGKRYGFNVMDTDAVDDLISKLTNARAIMLEPVSHHLEPNAKVRAITGPGIQLGHEPDGTFVMQIRHPGLGWWAYRFPGDSGRRLADALRDCL